MARIAMYRVTPDRHRVLWRIMVPIGGGKRKSIHFKQRKDALVFFHAAQKELKASGREKAVTFLLSGHRLVDALEAIRILRGVDTGPWQNQLRRSAALLVLVEATAVKEPGPFVEPRDRMLDLPPLLHRLVTALARRRGASTHDLVNGVLAAWVKEETATAVRFEAPARAGELYQRGLPPPECTPALIGVGGSNCIEERSELLPAPAFHVSGALQPGVDRAQVDT